MLLLLAACGGDDGGDAALDREEAAATTTTTTAPSTTEAPATTTTVATTTTTEPPAPAAPVAAGDPAGLAVQIERAETTIRSDGQPAQQVADAGHLQQVAYRQLSRHPEWYDTVRAALPPELGDVAIAHAEAARGLAADVGAPRENVPAWRIVPPAPAQELIGHYQAAATEFGLPWEYLAAIHLVETRMGRIRGVSTAGAQGPMQFLPGTWAAYGEGDINDNRDAIRAAARYLRSLNGHVDMHRALRSYGGRNAVRYANAVTTYAQNMQADLRTFHGYYGWQVYYLTVAGDLWLPVGYDEPVEIPVSEYLARDGR